MLRGEKCWMEDSDNRVGENGFSGYGHSNIQPPLLPAANFLDQHGAAYFGELEEALMQGVAGIRNDGDKKSLLLPTRPPPTLEIFPSWPMRSLQSIKENLHSEESTNSGSAQHTISQSEDSSNPEQNQHIMATDSKSYTQNKRRAGGSNADDGKKLDAKTLRRLAQNREAARKSRLRKKAYVQQLETSRIKLAQLEQDLQRARSQVQINGLVFQGGCTGNGNMSSGAAMFDMEYAGWLDENYKHMNELREGLQAQLSDSDLRVIVDKCLSNYDELFRLKAVAAKTDVFHLITGMWTTPAERCFIWMGGFRPSDLIKICMPVLDPLTEQQVIGMCSLQQSSQEAEEALSQGFEQLQQSLAGTISSGSLDDGSNVSNYMGHMAMALGKLANVEVLVHQADKLRQQALHQLGRILTIRQAARCFLAIGEYYNRLRALSSIWASRPRENIATEEGSYCPATADMQIIHQPLIQGQFSAF